MVVNAVNAGAANTAPLLERAFIFLEDGKWQDANIYCEKVLDIDPKNAEAYVGKLMAELQVKNRKLLADCENPFDDRDNYSKVLRFGDEKLEAEMRGYIAHINDRIEQARLIGIYNDAVETMNSADSEEKYKSVAEIFQNISGFKDSSILAERCLEKAEICRQEVLAKQEADRLEAERKAEEKRIAKEKAARKRKKIIAIGSPILVACVAFVILLVTVILPRVEYKKMTDYASAEVGDIVWFGTYEQDNDTANGQENIEWIVLEKEDDRILVISDKALDCQQYNTSLTVVTWENSYLRRWMNDTFLNNAFSEDEQAKIQNTTVTAYKNPDYSTNPSNDTTDKVFLLSITEAKKYFLSEVDRKCVPTAYAIGQGAYTSNSYTKDGAATCWWWLRSPGYNQDNAAYVINDGTIIYYGNHVDNDSGCVRPALWINLDS